MTCTLTLHETIPINTNESVRTKKTEGMRPNLHLSSQVTAGVSRKVRTTANAIGMKIARPKYKAAITIAIAISVSKVEEFGRFLERAKVYSDSANGFGSAESRARQLEL